MKSIIRRFLGRLGFESRPNKVITAERERLSISLYDKFKGIIKYGPFKGIILIRNQSWGLSSLGSKLLGIYEKEVVSLVSKKIKDIDIFVDIGAADGFYVLGCLKLNKNLKCFVYEQNAKSILNISKALVLNNFSSNLVSLNKSFSEDSFPSLIKKIKEEKCLILLDIEGAEYSVFSDRNLKLLKNKKNISIIVELHRINSSCFNEFLRKIKNFYNYRFITTRSRDIRSFKDLELLDDNHAWILASEGRRRKPLWIELLPF